MKPQKPRNLQAKVFDSLSEGSAARRMWSQLIQQSNQNTVFLLPGWLDAWHRSIGENRQMLVILVCQSDRPVLAAAFTRVGRRIIFAGQGPSDYAQLVIHRQFEKTSTFEKGIELLLDSARAALPEGLWFQLGRVPLAGATHRVLIEGCGKYVGIASTDVVAPRMSMQLASAALRKKSLRRHENKLKRRGKLEAITRTDMSAVRGLLPAFFDQHQRRWAGTGVRSPYFDAREKRFVQLCCEEMAHLGVLRFTEIISDDECVAFHFGFFHNRVFTWYKPTFDPNYSEYSPGEVLLKRLIERATLDAAEVFDFTIGNETFKRRFANEYPKVGYLNVSSSGVVQNLFRGRNFLRKLRQSEGE